MQNFLVRWRYVSFLLVATMLLSAIPEILFAQGDEVKPTNVSFKVTGLLVEVYYDLKAAEDHFYVVTVTLKKRFASEYAYPVLTASGDIGEKVYAGTSRKISWNFSDEFPKGLPGDDFYFDLNVTQGAVVQAGMNPVVYIAGGAAVVGGVLALLLLKKKTETVPPTPASGFPVPPGRP